MKVLSPKKKNLRVAMRADTSNGLLKPDEIMKLRIQDAIKERNVQKMNKEKEARLTTLTTSKAEQTKLFGIRETTGKSKIGNLKMDKRMTGIGTFRKPKASGSDT